jgi:hypothetical protein
MRNTAVNQNFLDDTKEGIRIHYADTPKPQNFKANNASHERGKQNKSKYVKKHCEICNEMGRSERAVASHTRDEHRDIPPRTRQGKPYHQEEEIKEDANYFLSTQTIYDTAANSHFFRDRPENYKNDTVMTAGGKYSPIVGEGTVSIGKLNLDKVQHVPDFKHNLVSGVELSATGHDQILNKSGELTINNDGDIVATGKIDKVSRLVTFDLPLHNKFAALTVEEPVVIK